MTQVDNRRLANEKTRIQTGLEYVLDGLNIQTPYGKKARKALRPFFPGQEDALRDTLDQVQALTAFVEQQPRAFGRLSEIFMEMKDVTYTISRSAGSVLSVVELFEVKSLLLQMREIGRLCTAAQTPVPADFVPADTEELLNELDPRRDRLNTFYIYDDFSPSLAALRQRKKELEREIRRAQKQRKEEISKKYGILLTPKFDVVIPRTAKELDVAEQIEELEVVGEDYMSVTFALTKTAEIYPLVAEMEEVNAGIDEEETVIREQLSQKIAAHAALLLNNCARIGLLDFTLAKASYAVAHHCVRPEITAEHVIEIIEGRQLQVEDILQAKGQRYCPVSILLADGVTCITGANMGGKTISLKLAGLVPLLAQYGLFVPCASARIGLSASVRILIGDSQSIERGLSSFGSEMEELKEMLDQSQERALLLIDEIASGTNPVEGLALTRSLVDYLMPRPYITLLTTHFEAVTEEPGVTNLQVRGLADVDFEKLDRELRYANRKERIQIIGKHMDYRLDVVTENRAIPRDALNIAKMLGIRQEILDGARNYLK